MRQIKFRVWSTITPKSWVTNFVVSPSGGICDLGMARDVYSKPAGMVLMQYTGLKDKNGVEIFEGDLVNFHVNGDGFNELDIGEVVYSERSATFMFRVFNHAKVLIALNIPRSLGLVDPDINCEVIGNIYENPNLLKENND